MGVALTIGELEARFIEKPRAETFDQKLYVVPVSELGKLLLEGNIHPQTKQVIGTILKIYNG